MLIYPPTHPPTHPPTYLPIKTRKRTLRASDISPKRTAPTTAVAISTFTSTCFLCLSRWVGG